MFTSFHPIPLGLTLIVWSYVHLSLSNGLFAHECDVSTSYHMPTTCPANFIILDSITYLIRSVRPETPHYEILPILQIICPPTLYCLHELPNLEYPQLLYLP
jgi:hypothetical protein